MTEYDPVSKLLVHHGGMPGPPGSISASATEVDRVRITFDQEMNHSASDPGTVMDHTAYTFSIFGGVNVTSASVVLIQAAPTIVDVVLNEIMTLNGLYTVYVTGVKSKYGESTYIDPIDTAFLGFAVLPQVESATIIDGSNVKVQFDKEMLNDVELTKTTNYTFSGPSSLTAALVIKTDFGGKTYVTVTVAEEMRDGGNYEVTAANVSDVAENPLEGPPNDKDTFTGIGVAPRVATPATSVDFNTIRVVYDEQVVNAGLVGSYSIDPALAITNVQNVIDIYTYEITTDPQVTDEDYTITVSNAVEDVAGNPIDPAHDEATFSGPSYTPPEVWMNPVSGTNDVRIRTLISVTCRDVLEDDTGINIATLDLKVSYLSYNGAVKERAVIEPGDLSYVDGEVVGSFQPGFTGEILGDPMDQETGVTIRFVPTGYWLPDTQYTVYTLVEDNESVPNVSTSIGLFITGLTYFFEDDLPSPTALDITMANGFPALPSSNQLREILMRHSTTSSNQLVQSRTAMYLATETEMRTLLAGYFDYSLVDDIVLGDRVPFLSVNAVLARYSKLVYRALDEIPSLTQTAKNLIMEYYKGNSTIYTVNAVAIIVLFAAILGDE